MTLKQLEAFYWAATLGTFAIAADRLNVTQSSLSKRIAELEADLGQPLFDRSGQRSVLTRAGEEMLPGARRMLDLERDIRGGLGVAAPVSGPCRFGISELSATTWFPDFVRHANDAHPLIELKPQVGLGRSLERSVERGELDCAVMTGSVASPSLSWQTVAEVEFAWMASPARLRKGTLLNADLLQRHPVIASTGDSGLTGALHAWSSAHDVQVREIVSCNSLTAILGMTVAGIGISFLPVRYVAPLVSRKLLVALRSDPPLPRLGYHFVWRRDDTRQMVATMKQLVGEHADFRMPNALWMT